MSIPTRIGIRAASALLRIVEESSAEELAAAEAILGNDKDLMNILQLLRRYKEHEPEPLSIERLRETVRQEILNLHLSIKDMVGALVNISGDEGTSVPSQMTVENVLDRFLDQLQVRRVSPAHEVDVLAHLLCHCANVAGPEKVGAVDLLLRNLAIQALAENLIMFPTLHTLAQLSTQWGSKPLSYQPHEARQQLASRLLVDAERRRPDVLQPIIIDLLREGLRGPADREIAALRATKPKRAHGA